MATHLSDFANCGALVEVLNRTRPLTLAMIRRLHKEMGIPAEVLIRGREDIAAA